MIDKNCLICNKKFRVHRYRRLVAKYCCNVCRLKDFSKLKSFLGKHHSEETKKNLRQIKLKNPSRYWLGKKFNTKHIKNLSLSHKGKPSNNFKGDKASYYAKHIWVSNHFGKPDKCERCGKNNLYAHKINWANISKEYKRERNDWLRLCRPCHIDYDDIINKGWQTRREYVGQSR